MSVSVSLPLNRDTSKYRSVSAEAGDETTGRRGIFSRYNNLHAYLYDIMDSYSNIDLNPYMCVHFIFFLYFVIYICAKKNYVRIYLLPIYRYIYIFIFIDYAFLCIFSYRYTSLWNCFYIYIHIYI